MSDNSGSTDRLIRRLTTRYLCVVFAVGTLVVVDQVVVQPLLIRLSTYAPAINLAGRQRMLSQKLAKAALAFWAANDEPARRTRLNELHETIAQWSAAQSALRQGSSELGIRKVQSPEIDKQWALLQPHYAAMCAAASQITGGSDVAGKSEVDAGGSSASDATAVDTIVAHEAGFLTAMDRIVKLLENDAAAEVLRLRACALTIAAVVVALLLGLGWLVVRPATRTIREQVDELESRIAGRTRDLSAAIEALRCEVQEREHADKKLQRLAAQLAHAERVSTMGHLTTGLAHELNQPLSAIANYAEACDVELMRAPDRDVDNLLQGHLGHIKQAALRAGAIVRRMRNFIRPGEISKTPVDVNLLVEEIVEFCRAEATHADVQVLLALTAQQPVVTADPIQIQQVLVNLVQNALQAVRDLPIDQRLLRIRTSATSDSVQVDVSDCGPGFDTTDAEMLFAPFRTTKPDGLGVGLAISRSIVEGHGGTLWAGSAPEGGARVSFALPLATPYAGQRRQHSDRVCR